MKDDNDLICLQETSYLGQLLEHFGNLLCATILSDDLKTDMKERGDPLVMSLWELYYICEGVGKMLLTASIMCRRDLAGWFTTTTH